jgi:aspartate/methionine/tyrosine aminotransferase
VPVQPDGAFYAYADASAAIERLRLPAGQSDGTGGSWDLAFALMERARVVVTPGRDFGQAQPAQHIRFSTASSMAQLQEAIARLEAVLA